MAVPLTLMIRAFFLSFFLLSTYITAYNIFQVADLYSPCLALWPSTLFFLALPCTRCCTTHPTILYDPPAAFICWLGASLPHLLATCHVVIWWEGEEEEEWRQEGWQHRKKRSQPKRKNDMPCVMCVSCVFALVFSLYLYGIKHSVCYAFDASTRPYFFFLNTLSPYFIPPAKANLFSKRIHMRILKRKRKAP